ncbi:protein kinase [bacterium]|nr:protein kinase [bacterium]
MELEPKQDDDFSDRLAKLHERLVTMSPESLTQFAEGDDADTDNEGLEPWIDCLTLLDRVRRRQNLDEALSSRLSTDDSFAGLPRSLGHFNIEKELGRGGAGIVLLATDTQLGRKVALKVPHPQSLVHADVRRRFIREAEASARLDHPNIVRVFSVDESGPILFLVSEYVEGTNLHRWRENLQKPVDLRVAATIVRDLARGVAHAHSQAVIHRDIKPSNVLLVQNSFDTGSSTLQVKLCDFGLAKVLDEDVENTRSGDLLGTPEYMSPEQASAKHKDVDTRTDVYSLGILLFELIAGQSPFHAESRSAILQKVLNQEAPYLRTVRRDTPLDLSIIVAKAIAKSKYDRYSSAQELADELDSFLQGEPIHARSATPIELMIRWMKRRPLAALSVALITFSLIALLAVLSISNTRVRRSLELASQAQQSAIAEADRVNVLLYAADMRYAQEALNQGNTALIKPILERYLPRTARHDLRSWPWYYLWNQIKRPGVVIPVKNNLVIDIEFSPDGKELVGGLKYGTVAVWDTASNKLVREASVHLGDASAVRHSPLTGKLWSCGDDGAIREWTGSDSRILTRITPGIKNMAFSPDGKTIASCNQWGQVSIVDVNNGKLIKLIRAHARVAACIEYSPDGRWLLSASEDGHLKLWSTENYQPGTDFLVGSKISCAAFSPDSKRIALGLWNRNTTLIVAINENHVHQPPIVQRSFFEAIQSPQPGSTVIVKGLSDDGTIVVGDIVNGPARQAFRWTKETGFTLLGSLKGPSGNSSCKECTANGQVVIGQTDVEGGQEGFYWSQDTGMIGIGDIPGGDHFSEAVSITPDGATIFGHSDGDRGPYMIHWDISDRVITNFPVPSHTPPNRKLLAVSDTGSFSIGQNADPLDPNLEFVRNFSNFLPLRHPSDWSDLTMADFTADGSTLTGSCIFQRRTVPYRWTQQDGFGLVPMPKLDIAFRPQSISGDGSLIVGYAMNDSTPFAAVWGDPGKSSRSRVQGFQSVAELAQRFIGTGAFGPWKLQSALAVSRDGLSIAGQATDPTNGMPAAWVLRLPTPEELGPVIRTDCSLIVVHRTTDHDVTVFATTWIDNDYLAIGDVRGGLCIVDTRSGKDVSYQLFEEGRISKIDFHRETDLLAIGFRDGNIRLIPNPLSLLEQSTPRHGRETASLAFDPMTGDLLDFALDGTVTREKIEGLRRIKDHTIDLKVRILAAAISPDGRWWAITDNDGHIVLIDSQTHQKLAAVDIGPSTRGMTWIPVRNQFVTATAKIRVFDPATGQLIFSLDSNAGTDTHRTLAASSDGRLLATNRGPDIEIWDISTRKQIATLKGHAAVVNSVRFSADNKFLCSASDDRTVRTWNLSDWTGKDVFVGHQTAVHRIEWLENDTSLVSADGMGNIFIWDLRSQQYVSSARFAHGPILAVSQNGEIIAMASQLSDETPRLWSAPTNLNLATAPEHTKNNAVSSKEP